jgi:hypothetical protein
MYRNWLINFNYFIEENYDTIEEAIAGGKKGGFEFSIIRISDGIIVGACIGVGLSFKGLT